MKEYRFKEETTSIALKRVEKAKELIANGASFNGTIYGRRGNSHSTDMEVYVDGEKIALGRYDKGLTDLIKAELLEYLTASVTTSSTQEIDTPKKGRTQWIVDDKVIYNNLNWAQMEDKYGICNFE